MKKCEKCGSTKDVGYYSTLRKTLCEKCFDIIYDETQDKLKKEREHEGYDEWKDRQRLRQEELEFEEGMSNSARDAGYNW